MKLHEELISDPAKLSILQDSSLSQNQMADKLSVSRPTIRKALKIIGITNKSQPGDFMPLVDENYPPTRRLRQPGDSHTRSFWSAVTKTDGCWMSIRKNIKCGGTFQMGRFSYALHYGQDPGGLNVARTCGNTDCIRPDHLSLSSEKNSCREYSSVIDDADVLKLVGRCELSFKEISKRLGVSKSYVSKLAREHLGKRRHSSPNQDLVYYPVVDGKPRNPSSQVRVKIHHLTDEQYASYCRFENAGTVDDCWEWSGRCISSGRATLGCFQKDILAPRIAYAMHYGVDPGSWDVLHTCDNPKCVNPNHLLLGDPQLNADHRAERNRFVASRGNTKIKPGSEEEKVLLDQTIPVTVVAKQLVISRRTVWKRRKYQPTEGSKIEPSDKG